MADLKIYDGNNNLLTINVTNDVYVSSISGRDYGADMMFDTSLSTYFYSQAFPSQYVAVRLPRNISKVQMYTRQDAFSSRWVGANVTVVTSTFNSTTVIMYDVLDKMFALIYNPYGLYNVSTITQPAGIVVNYTNPTSTFISSYFLTGPAFYRNGTTSTSQLYYVENGYIKPCTGVHYGLRGMGRIVYLTSYLNQFPVGPNLAITPPTIPMVYLWIVLIITA
jgi:hypothetical protein